MTDREQPTSFAPPALPSGEVARLGGLRRRGGRTEGFEGGISASRALVTLTAIAGVSSAAHVLLGAAVHGPLVFMDELGYQRTAWSLAHGLRLELFGKVGLAYSPLYSLVLAPLYALTSRASQVYEWTKAVNAVLMSLAVFPAYAVARAVLPRRPALTAAALAAVAPLTMYSSLQMSENLAYPLFLLALWATLRAIRDPSPINDVALLATTALAVAARLQLAVLFPATVTAMLLAAAVSGASSGKGRAAAIYRAVSRHRVFLAPIAIAGIATVARAAANGGSLPLAGRYANVGTARANPVRVAEIALQHLAGLDLALGVAPFAAALLGVVALYRSRFPRDAAIFAAVAVSVTFWLLLEVAFDAAAFDSESRHPVSRSVGLPPDLPRIHERYLIYLIPLFLVVFVAVLRHSRLPARAVVLASVAAAVLPGAIPFGRDINNSMVIDSFALQIFGVSVNRGPIQPIAHASTVAMVIAAVLGLNFMLAVVRRHRRSAVTLTAVVLLLMSAVAWIRLYSAADAASSTFRTLPTNDDWVDRVVGDGATVMVGGRGVPRSALLQTAFYNLSIDRIYYTCKMAFGGDFGEQRVTFDEGGSLRAASRRLRAKYAVVPERLEIRGRVLARDSRGGLVLIAPTGGALVAARGVRAAAHCRA